MYICVINIVKKKKKEAIFHLPHSVYDGSCIMCILNHHAAHIYLCGDVRRTVYRKIFRIYADRYTFHYPGLWKSIRTIFGIYVDRDTFHYLVLWEKYSEFMWIEIHSIIRKISIPCKPMFSLCDKNITWPI